MKKCTTCLILKPLEEFYKNPEGRDGTYARCKPCFQASVNGRHKSRRELALKKFNNPDSTGFCKKCKIKKPISEFRLNVSAKSGHSKHCKLCQKVSWSVGLFGTPIHATQPRIKKRKMSREDKAYLERVRQEYGDAVYEIYKSDKRDKSTNSKGRRERVFARYFLENHNAKVNSLVIGRIFLLNKVFGFNLLNFGWHCMSCRIESKIPHFFELDHIEPFSRGGSHNLENLQCLCPNCHKRKTLGIDGISTNHRFKIVNSAMERWFQVKHKSSRRKLKNKNLGDVQTQTIPMQPDAVRPDSGPVV